MARIPRNYIAELAHLGVSHQQVADLLGVAIRRVHLWDRQPEKFKPPKALYEPIRNIARRTVYKKMREAGYSPYRASEFRRVVHTEAIADTKWLQDEVTYIYNDWNARYLAYKRNPEGWIKAHPNKKIPTEISRADVKRRIEKGIKRGKSKEEIENY